MHINQIEISYRRRGEVKCCNFAPKFTQTNIHFDNDWIMPFAYPDDRGRLRWMLHFSTSRFHNAIFSMWTAKSIFALCLPLCQSNEHTYLAHLVFSKLYSHPLHNMCARFQRLMDEWLSPIVWIDCMNIVSWCSICFVALSFLAPTTSISLRYSLT